MNKYVADVISIDCARVSVAAQSKEEAEDIIMEMILDGKIHWDSNSVDFNVYKEG